MSGGVDDYSGVTDIARNGVDKVIRLERENAALRARVAESDAEIARLRERVAQLEPKAARYEWLRDGKLMANSWGGIGIPMNYATTEPDRLELDEAIDKAMEAGK